MLVQERIGLQGLLDRETNWYITKLVASLSSTYLGGCIWIRNLARVSENESMARAKRAIRAIDLFAGVGGSSRGALAAGVQIAAAVDHWPLARDTYKSNFPGVRFLNAKCEKIELAKLKKKVRTVDLILASPECTSHTPHSKRWGTRGPCGSGLRPPTCGLVEP